MPSCTKGSNVAASNGARPGGPTPTPSAGPGPALAPHARDPPAARRAPPVPSHPLLLNQVAVALDEQVAAVRAVGVLPPPDPAGKVPGIDELKARPRTDLARPEQRLWRRVVGVGHLVVLVERGNVPGDLG